MQTNSAGLGMRPTEEESKKKKKKCSGAQTAEMFLVDSPSRKETELREYLCLSVLRNQTLTQHLRDHYS